MLNENSEKTLIDWDLNIYMSEEFDEKKGKYVFQPGSWKIHVYAYLDGDHTEWDEPIALTAEEIRSIGLNSAHQFKDEPDAWCSLAEFKSDFGTSFSGRLTQYFDDLPKYWEDLKITKD